MLREAVKYLNQSSRRSTEREAKKNLSFMNFCLILQRGIQNPVNYLRWSFWGKYLTLWCVLQSLTTAHETPTPTTHELDLDH